MSSAAAPSEICEELPAVMTPPSGLNTVRSLPGISRVLSRRTPSSRLTTPPSTGASLPAPARAGDYLYFAPSGAPLAQAPGTAAPGSDGETAALQVPDPADGPEAALARREDLARLDQALAALPLELRECLVLRELEELSYKDVAHVTGVPIGTVMSRLNRGRTQLRALLADYAAERGLRPKAEQRGRRTTGRTAEESRA